MTTEVLDPRIGTWLDAGPGSAPPIAFETIMTAVATTAQEPRHVRLGNRVLPFTRGRLVLAAAALVAAVATGGYLLRDTIADVATPPPDPSSLLYPYPETRVVTEQSGGPAADDETIIVTRLPGDAAFVVVATCTGGESMALERWDLTANWEPGDIREPNETHPIECDREPVAVRMAVLGEADDANEIRLVVTAGTSWRIAIGEVRSLPDPPSFPAFAPAEGSLILLALDEPMLAHSRPGPGIGIQAPAGAETVTILVQCLGAPVTISSRTVPDTEVVPCDDPSRTTRVELPLVDGMDALAGTDGFTWVRLAAEAQWTGSATSPAPAGIPEGMADVWFASGDGSSVAFGRLGGDSQRTLPVPGSHVGEAGGDHVAIAREAEDGSTVLELWSMPDAAPVTAIATIADGRVFGSWVDPTHEQVFYGLVTGLGAGEWRRVGFDGTGDTLVASSGLGLRFAQQVLGVDDAMFVAQWCPLVGSCQRAIYDAATGALEQVEPAGEPVCGLEGVAGTQLVFRASTDCDTSSRLVAQDVRGGAVRELHDGFGSARTVAGPDGPLVIVVDERETSTTLTAIDLDGGAPRELATFEHESGFAPRVSAVRLPAGEWVLLAGELGDVPGFNGVGRPVPVLLNVVTGERIELPNLPHSTE